LTYVVSNVLTPLSLFNQQLFGFSQYNNIYNSYDRILDLLLSTKGCEVLRDNVPIVEEDAHHPALIVELSYNWNNLKKIAGHTDYTSIRYNFKKAWYPLQIGPI
jgi:hypothetical protein